jgi:4-alpha-glucanotransferase
MAINTAQLQSLCQLYGINTSYRDMNGITREASVGALLAVLQALGAAVRSNEDIPSAHRLKHLQDWQAVCPPVVVIWEGSQSVINLRLPSFLLGSSIPIRLALESGELRDWLWKVESADILDQKTVEGSLYLVAAFRPPELWPPGYHQLTLELPGQNFHSLIICAPLQAWSPPLSEAKKWGLFLPLYAAHSQNSWGAGNYTDLKNLQQWTAGLGGQVVGTLPLLAGFYDSQFGPGPYLPASKLFWNEFYLDLQAVPEFAHDQTAQALFHSPDFQSELSACRQSESVLYDRELKLKRRLLEPLAQSLRSAKTARWSDFEIYLANHPEVLEYAQFRAAGEVYGLDWRRWPSDVQAGAPDLPARRDYHAYAQWLAAQQIGALGQSSGSNRAALYLDLPVGVHPFSYDVWKEPESFVSGISCGAPPDPVFTNGQNWAFPPLHPQHNGSVGYRYFIRSLRHQLKACAMLRIDHMMNFHRLFWIPQGMPNREGVYVNYPAAELYAILTLESVRHKTTIIGEDLGLVPPEVRPMMEKHDLWRMFVGQFELISDNRLGLIPNRAVAGLNTHDMFPFRAFWEETDITQRQQLKIIDESTARTELEQRRRTKRALISLLQYKGLSSDFEQDTAATFKAVLKLLAESPAAVVLINLEDLWEETRPQNIPGTLRFQNWTRKAKYSLEQLSRQPLILQLLTEIDKIRKVEPPR